MTLFYVFIFGACIGSFLNVCIYRLPREMSLIRPRSSCPHCLRPIRWHDNVPILSYLILQGKCRYCHWDISIRYFLVECLTAGLTLVVWSHGEKAQMFIPEIYFYLLLTYALIVITFIDLEYYIIPDEISYSGLIVALILSPILPWHLGTSNRWEALGLSLLGALAGGGSLFLIGWIAKVLMKKEAMGLGDVKLMAMAGAALGWKAAFGSILIASVIGSIVGLILVLLRRVQFEGKIAFGPFLAMGVFVMMVWGDAILHWYWSFLFNFKI